MMMMMLAVKGIYNLLSFFSRPPCEPDAFPTTITSYRLSVSDSGFFLSYFFVVLFLL